MRTYVTSHVAVGDVINLRGTTLYIGNTMLMFDRDGDLDRLRAVLNPVTPEDREEKLRGELADEERATALCGWCKQPTDTDELDDAGECPECARRPEREEARREARSLTARSEEG